MILFTERRPTEAYIDLDALAFNFHSIRQFIAPGNRVMAVVKADGYGHGAAGCALRLEAEGVDWFGVAIPEEGVELRQVGIRSPILCLGSFWRGQEELIVANHLTPVVWDAGTISRLAEFLSERGITIDVHVKIDTGMGRVGVRYDQAETLADLLKKYQEIRVNGLLTHFASAEDPGENDFTALQIERFRRACDVFRSAGHEPEWIDLANSPGAIAHPEAGGNMVRLGGALYGLIDDILPLETERPRLKPVLSLHSYIADLKGVSAGESLGYGRTFFTRRDSTIALVPIGYADGYPRGLSNRGKAVVNDTLVPVVGRVSMDWTLLDVTDVPGVHVDDGVFLIGGSQEHNVKAADLAREIDTIGYEITCGISPRVPRIFLDSMDGKNEQERSGRSGQPK